MPRRASAGWARRFRRGGRRGGGGTVP